MNNNKIIQDITNLKEEKNAVILVHNYQSPEIYEVADFIGDSLELAQRAAEVTSDIIVFAGVDFMAEMAYILNPERKVFLPTPSATCPMAGMVNPEELRNLKKENPNAAVVSYVNTTAETKAESDICCTSANAIKVVNSLDNDTIIFTPDKNLANYIQRYTNKKIIPWEGFCYVHNRMSADQLKKAKIGMSDAKIIAHPECPSEIIDLSDYVCSTSQMVEVAKQDSAKKFIICTEIGMVHRLRQLVPEKEFCSLPPAYICIQMKKNNLSNIYKTLLNETNLVTVPEEVRIKAQRSLERMLNI